VVGRVQRAWQAESLAWRGWQGTRAIAALVFIGPVLTLSPLALGLQLFAILAGSALVAVMSRPLPQLGALNIGRRARLCVTLLPGHQGFCQPRNVMRTDGNREA
jgi:hypothetical protein